MTFNRPMSIESAELAPLGVLLCEVQGLREELAQLATSPFGLAQAIRRAAELHARIEHLWRQIAKGTRHRADRVERLLQLAAARRQVSRELAGALHMAVGLQGGSFSPRPLHHEAQRTFERDRARALGAVSAH